MTGDTLRRVAIFSHAERPDAAAMVTKLVDWLNAVGHQPVMGDSEPVDASASATTQSTTGADLAVSVGGDGTVLRAVNALAAHGVPVLGINVGMLGYLAEFEPPQMTDAVAAALAGELPIAERMMVQARLSRAEGRAPNAGVTAEGIRAAATDEESWEGLNEVALEKSDLGHTVRLAVAFDGAAFTTYVADGLILSTPTGSTAYSLSAGGAVVEPGLDSLQLTPVAPHMLFDRSIMLRPEGEARCTLVGDRTANLVVDGRHVATLYDGDAVAITRSPTVARLVTADGNAFHSVLKNKLGLRDR